MSYVTYLKQLVHRKKVASEPKTLLIVCGKLCSGKGTYCRTKPSYHHLTMSNIVKSATSAITRSQLSQTGDLVIAINQATIESLDYAFKHHSQVILEGIRQPAILDHILDIYQGSDVVVELVWLHVPPWVREERFIKRDDTKDDISFREAEQGDINLGIHDLYNKYMDRFKVVLNYKDSEL